MHYKKFGNRYGVQVFDGVCKKYTPGHAVHPIQMSVRGKEKKISAQVFPFSENSVRVRTGEADLVLFNHGVQGILDVLEINKSAKIEYSPTANLLFINTDEGSGFVFYMSIDILDECKHD